jgi:hypothetical protein
MHNSALWTLLLFLAAARLLPYAKAGCNDDFAR